MLHAQLAALALATTALAASGCGGSSKAGSIATAPTMLPTASGTTTAAVKTTPGSSLTQAQLVAEAGAICKRIYARDKSLKLGTPQATARELPLFASYQRTAFAELFKSIPPTSMTDTWKQFAAAAHVLTNDTIRFGEYVKAGRFSAAYKRILPMVDNDERRVTALAKHDSITGCEQIY